MYSLLQNIILIESSANVIWPWIGVSHICICLHTGLYLYKHILLLKKGNWQWAPWNALESCHEGREELRGAKRGKELEVWHQKSDLLIDLQYISFEIGMPYACVLSYSQIYQKLTWKCTVTVAHGPQCGHL